jgi:hypothetical protein
VTGDAARDGPALWVAIAATVLSLALPLVGDLPGRVLTVRVLLAAALVFLALALPRSRPQQAREHLVTAAIGVLVFAAALLVRAITPTGAVLLSIAIGSALWQLRVWGRSRAVRGRRPS